MTEDTYRHAFKTVLREHWRMLPIGTMIAATILVGLVFVFAEIEFRNPILGDWYARQTFRVIGVYLLWCPVWIWLRYRRGVYDD